jgi:hypothetical protein
MYGLLHGSFEPILYGFIVFVGLSLMWWKLTTGRWLSLSIDVFVFWLVFTLHGGSMTGGMSAAVAALLAGIVFPLFLKRS